MRDVLMSVLQERSPHWDSWLYTLGLDGSEADVPFCSARLRAHRPASGHLWAVSDRCSRQYVLRSVSTWNQNQHEDVKTYPLQLSQRNGRKSRTWQYSSWQCAPMDSTSPRDISTNVCGLDVAMVADVVEVYQVERRE